MKGKKTVEDYKVEFEGKKFVNKRGFEYEVLEVNSINDCKVYFPETNYTSTIRAHSLRKNTVSERFIDTIKMDIGDVFGDLTATGFTGYSGVVCLCSCGNNCEQTRSNLSKGKRTSCGCKPTASLYDKFWNRFNELVGKWNPDTHKQSVKKLPIFSFRRGSTDLEKITAFTYVDKDFYEVWKGYPFIKNKNGYVSLAGNTYTYTKLVGRAGRGDSKKRVQYKLHHLVRGHTNFGNYIVDHINSLPLDNRFSNLRTATHLENSRNSYKPSGKHSSIYKGVSFCPNRYKDKNGIIAKPWKASIIVLGKQYTKYSATEEGAAILYNALAIKHFGEFAKLNIIKLEND